MSQVGFLFYSEADEAYEVECPVCGEYNMVDSDDVHKILNKDKSVLDMCPECGTYFYIEKEDNETTL